MKICIPVEEPRALASPVCPHFGAAPFFLFVDTSDRSCDVVSNAHEHHEHGACKPLAALSGRAVEALVVGGIGRGALVALGSAGIAVYHTTAPTALAVVDALERGELRPMSPADTCAGHGGQGH